MTRQNWFKELTKEDLINKYKVVDVSADGKHVITDTGEVKQCMITTSFGKHYYNVSLYDKENRVKIPRKKKSKSVDKDGNIKTYEVDTYSYRPDTFGVHRLVYVWNTGITQPIGTHIDHINNDSLDNRLENLQLKTAKENINKDRKKVSEVEIPCQLKKPRSYYVDLLEKYEALYEEAKEAGDAELAHHRRANIYQAKARLRYYDNHLEEVEKLKELDAIKSEKAAWIHERARKIRDYDYYIKIAHDNYNNDKTEKNKEIWKQLIWEKKKFIDNNPKVYTV